MRKRILLILALLAVSFTSLRAQNVIDLIIAEALAVPDSTGIVDDYGRQGGWIEIFNTSQGTVNIAGCFLTDDRSNLKKSIIPKGDLRTKIGPRQTTLFYASGNGDDGTFYTSFKVRPGSTVYLVSNDGRTVIDSLIIPANIPIGMSMRITRFSGFSTPEVTMAPPLLAYFLRRSSWVVSHVLNFAPLVGSNDMVASMKTSSA